MNMKTKFIGHRGSLGFGVENTEVAFLGGVSRNVYGLECDIRISNDNIFFIMHDDTLNRFIPKDEKYVWVTVGDEKVRPEHEALDGTIRTWYDTPRPKEEYGCRCRAESVD